MRLQIRTMFPGGEQGVVCVLVDGSRRDAALGHDGIAASVALGGAAAIAEARRTRAPIRRATTNGE